MSDGRTDRCDARRDICGLVEREADALDERRETEIPRGCLIGHLPPNGDHWGQRPRLKQQGRLSAPSFFQLIPTRSSTGLVSPRD